MAQQKEWSKSLVSLANEMCNLKEIEVATPFSNCDDIEQMSPVDGMTLFLTVMENTSATIEDVFALLHPEILGRPASFDVMKYLPTCCDGERISTVLFSILDIIPLRLHIIPSKCLYRSTYSYLLFFLLEQLDEALVRIT